MGRFLNLLKLAPLALLAGIGFSSTPAQAAEPFDNDELVASPDMVGLPDKDSHSGVFLDVIAVGSNSVTQPNAFGIVIPAATPTLRVAIFDGNCAGLWDQNRIEYDGGGNIVPDGSVVEYTLTTAAPGMPVTEIATGDSQNAAPRPGLVFGQHPFPARGLVGAFKGSEWIVL